LKNIKAQISIGLVFMVLAFLVTIQLRSVTKNNAAKDQAALRMEEALNEIGKMRQTNDDLRRQLDAAKSDLDQYRKEASEKSDLSRALSDQLTRADISAGLVDVTGPGVRVTLNDAKKKNADNLGDQNATLIHDDDIRKIINELCAAGAEAVSVNDSRIISNSAVRCVGPVVLVNDVKLAPPYVIRAIGKPEYLEASLNINGGIVDGLRIWGFEAEVAKQDEVVIPKYQGVLNFKSAVPYDAEGGRNR
jgi:uncharacterized protein YlxW (UPF0749 family)